MVSDVGQRMNHDQDNTCMILNLNPILPSLSCAMCRERSASGNNVSSFVDSSITMYTMEILLKLVQHLAITIVFTS